MLEASLQRPELRGPVGTLAVALGEATLIEALRELTEQRPKLARLIERHGDLAGVLAALSRRLDAPAEVTAAALCQAACSDPALDEAGLHLAAAALAGGSEPERARATTIRRWLAADAAGRLAAYRDYEAVFLKGACRTARKSLITKPTAASSGQAHDALLAEQARLERVAERCKAATVAQRSRALLQLGSAVIEHYRAQKAVRAVLDYGDLIGLTVALLGRPGTAAWVRYKLDQRIDHVLVDEAQDTSPEQWSIVAALTEDFFTGAGARELSRTLFVVGDEKQSIFGFQGADLDTLQQLRQVFGERARAGGSAWLDAPLQRSFRSAPAILEAVDAVFADPATRAGVVAPGTELRHEASRQDAPGLVEVWPLLAAGSAPKPAPWALPDEPQPIDQAERRLADAIVRQIEDWCAAGSWLACAGRPVQPGDVMILLPRRGVMQELLIRRCKQAGLPIAGADRLALTDELAVQDLLALGDALLLPEDDLTLAAVLKSPLFGLDEEALFLLAHDRGLLPLHRRLAQLAPAHPAIADAHARFQELLQQSDFVPPFEFYARLLGAGGGRARLLARLGQAAAEPIEALLAQALAYERLHPPSLQGFLHWLRADTTDLMRDPDQARDEVRVLTVHGAKGLEAPIVILADTTYQARNQDRLLWLADGLPLWRAGQAQADPVSAAALETQKHRQAEEARRLLYVAMTRAQERLIVTGWEKQQASDSCWHALIRVGLERLAGTARFDLALPGGQIGQGWRHGAPATRPKAPAQLALALPPAPSPPPAPPAWLSQPAPSEPSPPPLAPSHADETPPASSPLLAGEQVRFGRGRLIHRLLQILPERPPAERPDAARRYLAAMAIGVPPAEQAALAQEVEAVLSEPAFARLFTSEGRAEVPLVGLVGGREVAGQVDRLVVLPDEVLVVDYKTNRQPPAEPGAIPPAYLRQMAAYRAVLRQIYPDRTVRCALLWTDGPRLVELAPEWLEPLLAEPGAA